MYVPVLSRIDVTVGQDNLQALQHTLDRLQTIAASTKLEDEDDMPPELVHRVLVLNDKLADVLRDSQYAQ